MNKFLIGAAVLAMAVPAFSQMQPAAPIVRPMPPMAPMMDRTQTRDQAVAKVREHFAMMDINRDGFVAGDELQSMRGARANQAGGMGGMGRHAGAMGDPGAMFDRIDANRDGMISRDEFAKVHERRMGGRTATNGIGGMGKMRGMRGQMGGRMMMKADLNQDGRISLQEATTKALQHFDMVDANRDGQITGDERRTMHQQRIDKKGRRAG